MKNLVIAPIGWRVGAVCGPLSDSRALGVRDGARVILVDTHAIRDAGLSGRACRWLERFPNLNVECMLTDEPEGLTGKARDAVDLAAQSSRVTLLLNGGTWGLGQDLLDQLWSHPGLRIATSRDDRATLIDPQTREWKVRTIESAPEAGVEALLELLDLTFDSDAHTLSKKSGDGPKLDGVIELIARAGFLFAALDPRHWPTDDHTDTKDIYRRLVLDHHLLWSLGLEQRRIFIRRSDGDEKLLYRCLEDGTPVERHDFDLSAWRRLVTSGSAGLPFCIPETQVDPRQAVSDEIPLDSGLRTPDRRGDWTEPPLITIVGTEPGTTLESIWSYRPRELRLVYDGGQQRAKSLAETIKRSPSIGCEEVHLHDLHELPDLTDQIRVDLRPGDKTSSVHLEAWRRLSEMRSLVPSRAPAVVPLKDWRIAHVRAAGIEWKSEPFGPSRITLTAALGALETLASTHNWSALDNLAGRPVPPHVVNGRLVLHGERKIPINELDSEFRKHLTQNRDGKWFEWCVAAALKEIALDEVELGYVTEWPVNYTPLRNRSGQRDELDVITRCGSSYTHWSVKTKTNSRKAQMNFLFDARAQADRLLGWERTAILAVPKLAGRLDKPGGENGSTAQMLTSGCASVTRQGRPLGFIVDATFLTGPHLFALAAGEATLLSAVRSST